MKKDGDLGLHTPKRRQLRQGHDTRLPAIALRGKEETTLHAAAQIENINKFEKQ